MAVLYNVPKDGAKFGGIFVFGWDEIKTTVKFSELKFIQSEDYYHIFCFADTVTDIIKSKEKDWKFEPQLMQFAIARKTVTENKKEREQHRSEKLICYALDKLDASKCYSGFFKFEDSGIVDRVVEGVDGSGKPIPEEVRSLLSQDLFGFDEAELTKFTEADMSVKKQWSPSGSRVQSEAERLKDRIAFVSEQLKLAGAVPEYKSLMDLILLGEEYAGLLEWLKVILAS
jgi:hypothetical protein